MSRVTWSWAHVLNYEVYATRTENLFPVLEMKERDKSPSLLFLPTLRADPGGFG